MSAPTPVEPRVDPQVLKDLLGVERLEDLDYDRRRELLFQVTRPLWLQGRTKFLLHATQRLIWDAVEASEGRSRSFFALCSRRLGKSFMFCVMADALARRKPNARILFLAPTKQNAREIASDLMAALLEFCPPDLKPDYLGQTHEFIYKNGSIIRLRGVNGETADNLRGGRADLVIADEAGFWDDLERVIQRVAMPMTMTTGGRIVCATTPPEDPAHYSAKYYADLSAEGAACRFTLLDAPHISLDTKAEYLKMAGEDKARIPRILAGELEPETTTALREYWCRFVGDAASLVVPEFLRNRAAIVQVPETPPFTNRRVALDPGFVDRTGILFAWDDFFNNRLVVEDEWLRAQAATPDIAKAVKDGEERLWGGELVYRRVSDIDLRLISDLRTLHGLQFHKAQKQDLKGGVNLVRTMIIGGQLRIHPRCTNLLLQLEQGIWNKKGTEFNNAGKESELGHLDALAALVYLCRDWYSTRAHNPYPSNWHDVGYPGGPPAGSWVSPRTRHRQKSSIFGDTPIGRRLAKRAAQHRH